MATTHVQQLPAMMELGPKGKKVATYARDWPGLERGAKTPEAALERLALYIPRYTPIAATAGLTHDYAAATAGATAGAIDVVEEYTGPGSTDFWGISFGMCSHDHALVTEAELERELALLQSCWAFFDGVRSRVSPEMRKGPRGGGRDRDRIVKHTLYCEADWAKGLGLTVPFESVDTPEGLAEHRTNYLAAFRAHHAEGKKAGKKSTLRYLIRHSAYHMLDHAWEMEDKDLTGEQA